MSNRNEHSSFEKEKESLDDATHIDADIVEVFMERLDGVGKADKISRNTNDEKDGSETLMYYWRGSRFRENNSSSLFCNFPPVSSFALFGTSISGWNSQPRIYNAAQTET